MIDLYFHPTSNGYRGAIALAECGLEYQVRRVDLTKGEQKSDSYRKINPFGTVPAIVDPDGPGGRPLTLAQSGAIMLYAAEKTGRLLPRDPAARALTLQWFMAAATDAAPMSTFLFYASARMPEKSAANTAFVESRFLGLLKVFSDRLADREWLADELSVADLALYPVVASRREAVAKAGGLEPLLRWADVLAARPGVQKAYAS